MASKDEQKGTHEPAMAPPGYKKTSEEAKGAPADAHGGPNKAQKTKGKPTWVQQGSKKVSKKGPNERP